MNIEEIRSAILADAYEFRDHARTQMRDRRIEIPEVLEAVLSGEIIEEYPGHIYGPCCLIYGRTDNERPLHVLLTPPPRYWIITVYEPGPERWIDDRTRRTP